MKTLDALITAVMGYAIVFVGIILLIIVVWLVGKVMVAAQKKPTPVPAAPTPAAPAPVSRGPKAPGAAGELKLYDTPDRDAAMIMAIVADELKIPVNELRFISIKEVKKR